MKGDDDQSKPVDEEDEIVYRIGSKLQGGTPVEWFAGSHQGPNGQKLDPVIREHLRTDLTPEEVRLFQRTRVRTCASCKHFDHRNYKPISRRFLKTLVHEYEWAPKGWHVDPVDKLGRCGQNPSLVTGPSSLACEQYKAR